MNDSENLILEKALELAVEEIARLNGGKCTGQCTQPDCDYYTETHSCLFVRKKYWKQLAKEKLTTKMIMDVVSDYICKYGHKRADLSSYTEKEKQDDKN